MIRFKQILTSGAVGLLVLLTTVVNGSACFQQNSKKDNGGDDGAVTAEIQAGNKLSIFDKAATYAVNLKSTYGTIQDGKVSYLVTTETGEKVTAGSSPVRLSPKGSDNVHFDFPEMKSGFYKVSFMVNLSDYDDTLKKAFGVSPQNIRQPVRRPADFDQFWNNTKAELAKVKPDFKMIEQPKLEKKGYKVFLVEMKSLDTILIRGWLTEPDRKGKFSTYLDLPGYQVGLNPLFADNDLAVLSLNVRGHGNSRDVIHPDKDDFVTLRLSDRNKYVYRGVIMDCIRAVDFIDSRPELDGKNIIVTSGSQGAYLGIALASLDNRVKLCSAKNPIFCDYRNNFKEVEWPGNVMTRYAKAVMHGNMEKLMDNLDYYDGANFAVNVNCNILIGMGLLDFLSPPDNVYLVYNLIPSKNKKLLVYPNLTHEVGADYQPYEYRWSKDEFGLYN